MSDLYKTAISARLARLPTDFPLMTLAPGAEDEEEEEDAGVEPVAHGVHAEVVERAARGEAAEHDAHASLPASPNFLLRSAGTKALQRIAGCSCASFVLASLIAGIAV